VEHTVRCGTLEVYEDRAARKGRKIGLRIAVMPADHSVGPAAPDPLFILVGGPGQAAVPTAKAFSGIFAGVLRERDVVLVDLRGTGGSNPLKCSLGGSDDDPQSYFGAMLPAGPLRDCLARLDADPRLYTTPIAMDDLDDVREALGYQKINLYGSSFGSRAAMVYVRQHGERVRSVILRGVVPQNMKVPLYYARDAQRALDLLFADCAADAACRQAYPDLPGALRAAQERLAREPVPVETRLPGGGDRVFRFRLSLGEFNEALRNRLYGEESGEIPLYLSRASQGDFSDFARGALLQRRAVSQGVLAAGLFLSVTCAEDVAFIDPEEAKRLAAGTFLGTWRVDQQAEACRIWPRGTLPKGYWEDVRSDVPALLISGQRDPVAPPVWGDQVLRHLPNGRHVVIAQGYHGLPPPCVTRLMNDFVHRGTAGGLDTSCADQVEKVPFLLPGAVESHGRGPGFE
jgi:pimeloyl-ACP methyl ester carboxylesterase